MELGQFFVTNKPREIAGTYTSDKFTYQQEWALDKIIDLFEENKDFALIMEYHEDIVIFNSSNHPEHVDLFQIKTNEKKNESFVTPSILLKRDKDKNKKPVEGTSYMEKLFYNFSLFNDYHKNIYFISNKPFNFDGSSLDSEKQNPIFLDNLSEPDFQKFTTQICSICGKINCKEECKSCIAFEKSALNVETSYEQLFVKLQTFISRYAQVTYSDNKAIYNTLMSQIKTINDSRDKYSCNFKSLIRKYTISKESLKEFLNKISFDQSFTAIWSEIHATLLSEKYKLGEIKRIKSSCQKYILEALNDFEGQLNNLIDFINTELATDDSTTLRETIEFILNRIKLSSIYDPLVYDDDFYRGAIIMRWFSE